MRFSEEFDFEFVGDNYTALVEIKAHWEKNYGADADGNRGVKRFEVDKKEIKIYNEKGFQVLNNKELEKYADYYFEKYVEQKFLNQCSEECDESY